MDISKISGSLGNPGAGTVEQSVNQAEDGSFEKQLKAAIDKNDDKALKSVCQQFEGIMLNMMFKQMKAAVIKSDLIEQDEGTKIFESMLDDSLMGEASKTGSFGLAEALYKQLSKRLDPKNTDNKITEEN